MTSNKIKWILILIPMYLSLNISSLSAQDKREVLEIRTIYKETNQRISECEKQADEPCDLYHNVLIFNKENAPWAAVGIYQSTQDFWYESVDEEPGEVNLRKAVLNTIRSAYVEHEEYLYNEAGQLIFYFFQLKGDNEILQSFRFYFNAGNLVDYKEKVDGDEDYPRKSKGDVDFIEQRARELTILVDHSRN